MDIPPELLHALSTIVFHTRDINAVRNPNLRLTESLTQLHSCFSNDSHPGLVFNSRSRGFVDMDLVLELRESAIYASALPAVSLSGHVTSLWAWLFTLTKLLCQLRHQPYRLATSVVSYYISTGLSEILLTLRSWVVLGKSKRLAYRLFGWLAIVWIAVTINGTLYLKNSNRKYLDIWFALVGHVTLEIASLVPPLGGCIFTSDATHYLMICYAAIFVYDTVILLLLIARGVKLFGSDDDFSQLWWVAYRDALSLTNVVIMFLNKYDILLLVTLEMAVHSVSACRVVLHIREQAHLPKIYPKLPMSVGHSERQTA
ncbi:hypothetical protein NP233_g6223 [Leucocoprinus birnbaumii]|uniref:Uncharacterized protein n=1 Tax=Leucocoprinus birnbaumii TaxID=56174 RepID=A0AAD5VTP2_9AGAR|nr:hypothetical protein NP233_g6223 [Leucocoprinus birnbaumii]